LPVLPQEGENPAPAVRKWYPTCTLVAVVPCDGGPPAMLIQSPSLLITDDDRGFRETLRGVFEPEGFRTILAGDGEEAISIVRAQEVHLVLLDMHMPKLTGLETLRLLKQFKAMLPCILLSAQLDELIIEQARLARAFSVLAKPVTRHQLTRTVRQALERTYDWHG
jgi:CheY-like chemotaxis protein